MSAIKHVETRLFKVPLPEVLSDAKHGDHTDFELVTVTISLEDGSVGTGYTYTGGKGGHAIKTMVEHDLAPDLIGKDGKTVTPFCASVFTVLINMDWSAILIW